jgi:hypothetical protein
VRKARTESRQQSSFAAETEPRRCNQALQDLCLAQAWMLRREHHNFKAEHVERCPTISIVLGGITLRW